MATSEEQQILRLLAKEWEHSGPPGIMDVSDIVASLDQGAQCHHAGAQITVSSRTGRYERT
jgi:hypothetical protein